MTPCIRNHWQITPRGQWRLDHRTASFLVVLSIGFIFPKATAFVQNQPRRRRLSKIKSSWTGLSSMAGNNEQAFEAIQSLVDFHQGEWKGRAHSFSVTPDIAAGIVQRKISPEYTVFVKLVGTENQPFSLSETFSWEDNNKVSFRTIPLEDSDFDVDSVDASYSLDSTNKEFPLVLSGTEKPLTFIVEHCIATGESRRARCFALYGIDKSLVRVIVSQEERVGNDNKEKEPTHGSTSGAAEKSNALTAKDLLEMQSDVDRLVDRIVSNVDYGNNSPSDSRSPSSADNGLLSSKQPDDFSSRLNRSLADSASSTESTEELVPHDISLLELSSGVWLGDAFIRDTPGVATSPMERGRGFGNAGGVDATVSWRSKVSRNFGFWTVGVQKVAWRWMWNFEEEIRQVVDVGKALGNPLEAALTQSLSGTVCVEESLSRRIPKGERMVYVDWSQRDAVGFLLGSCSVQVPRYINFDTFAATTSYKPFYTEFGVFQRNKNSTGILPDSPILSDAVGVDLNESADSLLVCSKISRLYNFEGRLKQGCSSFYTFKRFGSQDNSGDEVHF